MRVTSLALRAVADTNFLVAVMVEDDKNHKEALRIWESLEEAIVPTVVIFELAYFLVKFNLEFELIAKVATDPKVHLVENNLDDILFLARSSSDVRRYDDVGDQIILSVARRMGIGIQTFDRALARRSAAS
jgi:uncharacterized protein